MLITSTYTNKTKKIFVLRVNIQRSLVKNVKNL